VYPIRCVPLWLYVWRSEIRRHMWDRALHHGGNVGAQPTSLGFVGACRTMWSGVGIGNERSVNVCKCRTEGAFCP
jgi:hypothetical protein